MAGKYFQDIVLNEKQQANKTEYTLWLHFQKQAKILKILEGYRQKC